MSGDQAALHSLTTCPRPQSSSQNLCHTTGRTRNRALGPEKQKGAQACRSASTVDAGPGPTSDSILPVGGPQAIVASADIQEQGLPCHFTERHRRLSPKSGGLAMAALGLEPRIGSSIDLCSFGDSHPASGDKMGSE